MAHPLDGNSFLFKEAGRCYQLSISLVPVEAPNDLFQRVAQANLPAVSNLFALPTVARSKFIIRNPNLIIAAMQLSSLAIRSNFVTAGDYFVPTWNPAANSLEMVLHWSPPPNHKMHLGVECHYSDGNWQVGTGVFFVTKEGVGGFHHPPMPNLHNDGRICLGDRCSIIRHPTLQGFLERLIDNFSHSKWGTDLVPDLSRSQAAFRWRRDTCQVVPADGLVDVSVRRNHALMSEVLQ